MNIGLIDVDGKNYPNLALMKISAYHKAKGHSVEMYSNFEHYDIVYMSKVFTFTPDYDYFINNADKVIRGGTGYDVAGKLPKEIDRMQPDYSLYPYIDKRTSYGFLTRGCPNRCKWCVVPRKEGKIQPYMDIDEITQDGKRPYAILMDNNILASDYGIRQLEKIADKGYHVDFNQGLDARLVTDDIARLLARIKWIRQIRFGCDRATDMIDKYGYKGMFFFYCILIDFRESFERVNHWKHKGKRYIAHAQPYRDFGNTHQTIPQWQKDMARWVDRKELFATTEFKDYSPRKSFLCQEYFDRLK